MYELSDLFKSVSRVSLLGENYLHIHFHQGTPKEKIESFLVALDLQVPGMSLTYPMIALESQVFPDHISLRLVNPPAKKIREVLFFELQGKEKKGEVFQLSQITH